MHQCAGVVLPDTIACVSLQVELVGTYRGQATYVSLLDGSRPLSRTSRAPGRRGPTMLYLGHEQHMHV